jgi:hypothetical protein
MAQEPPVGQGLHIFEVSRLHSLRRTIFCRTPLDEWSARRRNFYLTTHNTHNKQISMPAAGFKPTIPTCGPPQTPAISLSNCLCSKGTLFGILLYSTVSKLRKLDVRDFDLILSPIISNFREWCRWSGMRRRGWRVCFPHSSAYAQISLSSVKFSLPLTFWRRNFLLNFSTPCI